MTIGTTPGTPGGTGGGAPMLGGNMASPMIPMDGDPGRSILRPVLRASGAVLFAASGVALVANLTGGGGDGGQRISLIPGWGLESVGIKPSCLPNGNKLVVATMKSDVEGHPSLKVGSVAVTPDALSQAIAGGTAEVPILSVSEVFGPDVTGQATVRVRGTFDSGEPFDTNVLKATLPKKCATGVTTTGPQRTTTPTGGSTTVATTAASTTTLASSTTGVPTTATPTTFTPTTVQGGPGTTARTPETSVPPAPPTTFPTPSSLVGPPNEGLPPTGSGPGNILPIGGLLVGAGMLGVSVSPERRNKMLQAAHIRGAIR